MTEQTTEQRVVTVGMETESVRMESQTVTSETQVMTAGGAAAQMMCDMEETMPRQPGKTDSPSKRKGDMSLNNTVTSSTFDLLRF